MAATPAGACRLPSCTLAPPTGPPLGAQAAHPLLSSSSADKCSKAPRTQDLDFPDDPDSWLLSCPQARAAPETRPSSPTLPRPPVFLPLSTMSSVPQAPASTHVSPRLPTRTLTVAVPERPHQMHCRSQLECAWPFHGLPLPPHEDELFKAQGSPTIPLLTLLFPSPVPLFCLG